MTMLRPDTNGFLSALSSIPVKTAIAAVIGVTAWHYVDSGKIEAHQQQLVEHGRTLAAQADAINHKVDRETYEADQKEIHEQLREIRNDTEQILILERHR